MKKYTTYEQTMDRETDGKDTRCTYEWFLYYLQYVDDLEYPSFITWFFDMLKTGILTEEKEEKTA